MGLAEVQKVMAELFIDQAIRSQFFDDPTAIGAKLGLSAMEAQSLAQVSQCQFEQFGNSLVRKRRDQVRRSLPNTAGVLGREFTSLFDRYMNQARPRGSRADLDDAADFVAALERSKASLQPEWIVDLAQYELAWRCSARPGHRLIVRRFRFPICRTTGAQDPGPTARRPTLAIWWRPPWRKSVRHVVISAPVWRFRRRNACSSPSALMPDSDQRIDGGRVKTTEVS
jgi:hypothetical protein